MTDSFPPMQFSGTLRPAQADVIAIASQKLASDQRQLHIVAPPGSGKTVLGLYLWAMCVRRPAVVLSPNSAIQAQWAARVELFAAPCGTPALVSTDSDDPCLLTSLTYQSLTLPRRGDDDLDADAIELWRAKLIDRNQAKDPDEADAWITDLQQRNPSYHADRLAAYRKEVRDQQARAGDSAATLLHASSLAAIARLRQRGVGLVIFDECHHLLGHWGRVLADVHQWFDRPIVLGLTATPPDIRGKPPEDVRRYAQFFGPVDYEVPVPAVVKDGYLAPYQDLVYFVRPTPEEIAYIAGSDRMFQDLLHELCQPREDAATVVSAARPVAHAARERTTSQPATPPAAEPPNSADGVAADEDVDLTPSPNAIVERLPDWLARVLAERRLPSGRVRSWSAFERRDPEFADAARVFLLDRGVSLPPDVPPPDHYQPPSMRDSTSSRATAVTRQLDGGASKPNSPIDLAVLVPVLDRYIRHGLRRSHDSADHDRADRAIARLRMLGVQITETGSQACASPISRVLAYSRSKADALRAILQAEHTVLGDRVRAVVVTDFEKTSVVSAEVRHLLDDEAGGAVAAFRTLLRDPGTDALNPVLVTGSTVLVDDDLAESIHAAAVDWLREKGVQVELMWSDADGFRVLTGRGADWCPRVYVEMITELFQRGLTKCLVGTRGLLGEGWDATKVNVLVDLTSVTTSMSANQLRGRSIRLDHGDATKLADNWDVVCVAPEFVKGLDDYDRFVDRHATLFGLTEDGTIEKGAGHVHAALTRRKPEGIEDSMQFMNNEMLARVGRRDDVRERWRIGEPFRAIPTRVVEIQPFSGGRGSGFPPYAGAREAWTNRSLALAVGRAVLGALQESGLLTAVDGQSGAATLHASQRAGGYVRVFLQQANEPDRNLFAAALHEALGPLESPRYVIPRFVDSVHSTLLSRILPAFLGRFFERRRREFSVLHAVPSALGKNKELAALFQRHWNRHVSPGTVTYAYQPDGERLLEESRRAGKLPTCAIHDKEVYV